MEYEEVLQQIGDFGRYQKRLLVILFFPVLFSGYGSSISIFLVGDHRYRCKIPSLPNDTYAIQDSFHSYVVNTSIPKLEDGSYDQCHIIINDSNVLCNDWVFDYSVFTNTINSQFNLVCENKLSNSHAIATYFMGQMSAPFLAMPFGDIIGRQLLACISVSFVFLVNITMPFTNSVTMFAIFRYFDGLLGSAIYTTIFVIGLELLSAPKRVITGTVILLVYCCGLFVLAILAYFIRDWRWLQLTVAAPMVIPLLYWWPKVLPESVRWLISRGRMDEAIAILRRVARTNKRSLPKDLHLKYEKEKIRNIKIIKQLFSSRKLLLYWGIVSANWFVVSFVYFGIRMNIGKLGGNLYVSFVLLVIAEAAGSALLFTMDFIGHKRLHMIAMAITCLACALPIFLTLFSDESMQWMVVASAVLGKLFVSTAFGMIYVYTGEIFPTVVRQFTIGSCAVFARIGSLCSPYLYYLSLGRYYCCWIHQQYRKPFAGVQSVLILICNMYIHAEGKMKKALPLILYSVIIAVVTLLTLILPETNKKKLPDHVKESENSEITNGQIQSIPIDESETEIIL